MGVYINLKSHIEKKKELQSLVNQETKMVNDLAGNLTMEDVKDLSYEEMKFLYDNLSGLSKLPIKEEFMIAMSEKKRLLYPVLEKAYHYPVLNELDLPMDIIKKIDEALNHMRVSDYIMPDSSLWRPLKQYLDLLVPLGVAKCYYELTNPEEEDDFYAKSIISGEDIAKHKEVWALFEKIKNTSDKEERDKLYEQVDALEVDGYGCIYLEEYEILDLAKFDKTPKSIRYRVVMQKDTTYDNI